MTKHDSIQLELIKQEISSVDNLIKSLISFKNNNSLATRKSRCEIKLCTFMKHGLRYSYPYYVFKIDFNSYEYELERYDTKKYKSINVFLHDLKRYKNYLQKTYSTIKNMIDKKEKEL